jgi:glutamyl-tRNA synthetase
MKENGLPRKVIVRFAPSPTGIPHVGNIRTALFNYFFARASDGEFILRIEDTDQARKVEGAIESIKESLSWLGITWDNYIIQSENLKSYEKYARGIVSKGLAREDDGAVRFIVPEEGVTSWEDRVGNKTIEFKNSEIEDFVILKSDGFPTYHLANVIDDHGEKITHVIRGEDWIPSTPKHILLYKALGWGNDIPLFAHVPNILGTDRKKLSKRRGAKSVLDFKKEGILSSALLNYLMLLGWSPKNDREILSKKEIEKEFKLENINTAPAIFDERKLLWMNGEYIRNENDSDIESKIIEFDSNIAKDIPDFKKYIPLARTRMKTLAEFRQLVTYGLSEPWNTEQEKLAQELINVYRNIDDWKATQISTATITVQKQLGSTMQDVYTVLTGKPQGLPFAEKLEIEGKQDTIGRVKDRLNK